MADSEGKTVPGDRANVKKGTSPPNLLSVCDVLVFSYCDIMRNLYYLIAVSMCVCVCACACVCLSWLDPSNYESDSVCNAPHPCSDNKRRAVCPISLPM